MHDTCSPRRLDSFMSSRHVCVMPSIRVHVAKAARETAFPAGRARERERGIGGASETACAR